MKKEVLFLILRALPQSDWNSYEEEYRQTEETCSNSGFISVFVIKVYKHSWII